MAQPSAGLRPFICAANWKMHKSPREAVAFADEFAVKARELPASRQTILFAPAVDLWPLQQRLRDTNVAWGAQNCHWEMKGAFTGETSPAVLAEMLTPYCLIGHSERRSVFGETDEMVARKAKALHQVGIVPMMCVGESLAERESGRANQVIETQLRAGLALRDPQLSVIVAYEPVWAIGTGKVATPQQANDAHAFARGVLRDIGGEEFAARTCVLYGGSVKPENARELEALPEVDGFLVGGASLDVSSFWRIVHS